MKQKKPLSLKAKMVLSLSAIGISILVSCIISVIEYRSMSTYVSDLIAEDVKKINQAQNLEEVCAAYNLQILTVIGDDSLSVLPDFDRQAFVEKSMELPKSEEVILAYDDYMETSRQFEQVRESDFIDTRAWYFNELQPKYQTLNGAIANMSADIYQDLKNNSEDFDSGFYRSQVPGIVAVGVGLLLILILMFFLLVNYVNPLYKMLSGLKNYRSYNSNYRYDFDGDDQLRELNQNISELIAENQQLHKRIADRNQQ